MHLLDADSSVPGHRSRRHGICRMRFLRSRLKARVVDLKIPRRSCRPDIDARWQAGRLGVRRLLAGRRRPGLLRSGRVMPTTYSPAAADEDSAHRLMVADGKVRGFQPRATERRGWRSLPLVGVLAPGWNICVADAGDEPLDRHHHRRQEHGRLGPGRRGSAWNRRRPVTNLPQSARWASPPVIAGATSPPMA